MRERAETKKVETARGKRWGGRLEIGSNFIKDIGEHLRDIDSRVEWAIAERVSQVDWGRL